MKRSGRLVAGLLLLVGCKQAEQAEQRPVEDQSDLDKRECVAKLTAGADPRVHTLLRSLCAELIGQRVPGAAFALVEPGKPPIHAEYGVRCFGEPATIDPPTRFRIGSVSKPITAALAFGLIDEGKLALGSDAELLPGFTSQTGLASPRLDALLRHRSGLGEIDPAALVELDGAWLPALARSRAAGSAGEYHYSNAGYSVVGAMLEAASGRPYAELVAARVFEPLALTRSTADPTVADTACGHLAHDDELRPIPTRDDLAFMPGDPRWMAPAGGLLSSAIDLASFALAIGSERLPGTAAMLEPGDPLPDDRTRAGHRDQRYGYGLRSWQLDADTRAYGHSGNNQAFVAELMFVPDVGAIVILANRGVELPATLTAAEALLAGLGERNGVPSENSSSSTEPASPD
ncbi:MAG TPA: serine hydrolase domain-containing protein [Enhygromyxa sp.]|nr:serine hydrolase domain-containing protein [Enhygromyxa sp.]